MGTETLAVKKIGDVDVEYRTDGVIVFTDYEKGSKIKVMDGPKKWEEYFIAYYPTKQVFEKHFNSTGTPMFRVKDLPGCSEKVKEQLTHPIKILPDNNVIHIDEYRPSVIIMGKDGFPSLYTIDFSSIERLEKYYKPCIEEKETAETEKKTEKIKIDPDYAKYYKENQYQAEKFYGETQKPRYYDTMVDNGTIPSVEFYHEHKQKIGKIYMIECYYPRTRKPYLRFNTRIVGVKGEILLSNLNCGYGGQGPSGLWGVLTDIGAENRMMADTELIKHDYIVYSLTESGWKVECRNPEEAQAKLK